MTTRVIDADEPRVEHGPPDGHRRRLGLVAVAVVAGGAALLAARDEPILTADSITYLSAAENLRDLDGFRDFTGEPLAHFPPVFPLLLSIGGRSLQWAALVGALAAAAVSALFVGILAARVRWSLAVAGALVYALSQAVVRTESTVWSETPYVALATATIWVLRRGDVDVRRAAAAGVLAGLAFLTRYAGAGLVVTGLVMIVAAAWPDRQRAARSGGAFVAISGGFAAGWMVRNLLTTGEPLGPHFEGGASDSLPSLAGQLARSSGRLVIDLDDVSIVTQPVGGVVLAFLVAACVAVLLRRRHDVLDVGMAVFASSSILIPLVSRIVTGTHIEARIMSPTLIPLVYFIVVATDRWEHRLRDRPALGALVAVLAVTSVGAGVHAAWTGPDRVAGSASSTRPYSPGLYQAVADLPDDAHVMTNNPWRVWWQTGHDPVRFAFTVPTPGNSHFPLTADEIVARACDGEAYLAWFPGLMNAGGLSPGELRPDLATLVGSDPVVEVDGGQLFRLTCPSPDLKGR